MTQEITISASQLSTFKTCSRSWWFSRVAKLPTLSKGYFTFGTILHAVLERWLAADEVGRVPADNKGTALEDQTPGEPVNLYPEGWTKEIGRNGQLVGEVSPVEAAQIRKLVAYAIEHGLVERESGRHTEFEFKLPVIDRVKLTGVIDLLVPSGIDDFKTSKDSRYLKQPGPKDEEGQPIVLEADSKVDRSPNCVGDDGQLLTYAHFYLQQREDKTSPIRLRHIQFLKGPNEKTPVRVAEAWVAPSKVEANWKQIQQAASKMLELTKETKWDDVPGPESGEACMAYGGCPFLDICGRRETPEIYRARVERVNASKHTADTGGTVPAASATKEKETMTKNIFSKKPQTAINSTPAAPAPAVASEKPSRVAPWARQACKACSGSGISPSQRPCLICDSMNRKEGLAHSGMFDLSNSDDGLLQWKPKSGTTVSESPAPEPVKAEAKVEAPAPAPAPAKTSLFKKKKTVVADPTPTTIEQVAPEVVQEAAPEVAQETAPEVEEAPAQDNNKKGKVGRPPAGFTLLIDCAQLCGPLKQTITLAQVISDCCGGADYYAREEFGRRRALQAAAEKEIVPKLSNKIVLASSGDPDSKALIQALIPHANAVYTGVR